MKPPLPYVQNLTHVWPLTAGVSRRFREPEGLT